MAAKLKTVRVRSIFNSKGDSEQVDNYFDKTHVFNGTLTNSRTDGGQIPNWKEKIRKHESATTPVSGIKWSFERSPGRGVMWQLLKKSSTAEAYQRRPVYWSGYPWQTSIDALASSTVITDGKAEQLATRKFFRKYRAASQGMDGLVSLGELRETLRMLRNPAESLFKAIRNDYLDAVKRLKKRSPVKDPDRWKRSLSGLWLEQSFGWVPFLSDIGNALDALDHYNNDPTVTKMITAVGRQWQHQDGSTVQWSPDNHDLVFKGEIHKYLFQKVKYRALYLRSLSEIKALTKAQRAREAFGLNLENFVPAAWELLPWSFLVDYFTNVGDILEQSFTDTRNIKWVNKTVINEGVYELSMPVDVALTRARVDFINWSKLDTIDEWTTATCSITRRQFIRTAGGPTVQALQFELPGKPMKWLNMTALGVQANSIHPQKYFYGRR